MGIGQRRPSRSPRSQRSRSADVDCLKKYTERRVEERRHTEVPDASKMDPSSWIPLPKNVSRAPPTIKKSRQSLRDEEKRRSASVDTADETAAIDQGKSVSPKKSSPTREEGTKGPEDKEDQRAAAACRRPTAGRSQSTDVGHVKSERLVEERRHTECSDPRTIATRWISQINTSRFRYDASPFARISNSCEITKKAATRWMTFVKNPSPSSIPRTNPDRKSAAEDAQRDTEDSRAKDVRKDTPKWEPLRKFSPVTSKSNREAAQKQDKSESNRNPSPRKRTADFEQCSTLTQRMRDLYDFKTENEWPKRATNPRRENTWISKSSSEEEKNIHSIRRNSQDLEFNDRVNRNTLKDTWKRNDREEDGRKLRTTAVGCSGTSEVGNNEYEERLRKFNEKLRYSEDLGTAKPRLSERRTYSDDQDEKARRSSPRSSARLIEPSRGTSSVPEETKRNSDASTRSSRGSYAEVNPVKRDSRTSTASYASIRNCPAKRGSVECKSSGQMFELPPRRAFSQTDERPTTASKVPPAEWNDDRHAPAKSMSERQKRDSTRYKVYLT